MDKVKKISKYVMNFLAMINLAIIKLSPIWDWHLEKVSETITVIMAIIGIYLVGGKLFTMANKEDEDKEEII